MKQVIYRTTPVLTSVVSYNVSEGEEPFLSYTHARAAGPILKRSGSEAPEMQVIDGQVGDTTADPVALRFGSWLVLEECRDRDAAEIRRAVEVLPQGSMDLPILEQMLAQSATIESHEKAFARSHADWEVVGMQGCGDLTMNEWNVAYVRGAASHTGAPALVGWSHEPLDSRRYTCLVKWKMHDGDRARVSIEEVKFNRFVDQNANSMVWVRFGDRWLPRGNSIEFALSSQQVIRNGAIVSAVAICHQFSDLRHLVALPNLNPDEALLPEDRPPYRPRRYFAADQKSDVWLGEKYLLDGGSNIRRAALTAAVAITIPHDCRRDVLRAALERTGYTEVLSATIPLERGQWRFTDLLQGERNAIEIYLRRNTYAWTMLGLTRDNDRILSLASQAKPGDTGYTLEEAANILLDSGAWNAILIDEGADVFQIVRDGAGNQRTLVDLYRNRLRAVFLFARRRGPEGGGAV